MTRHFLRLAVVPVATKMQNLKKSIAYTLAHAWPELFPVFLNLAFSFPLALPGLIILTIDLITEQVSLSGSTSSKGRSVPLYMCTGLVMINEHVH